MFCQFRSPWHAANSTIIVQDFLVHSAQLVSIAAGLHDHEHLDHVALCRLPVELSRCSETGSIIDC